MKTLLFLLLSAVALRGQLDSNLTVRFQVELIATTAVAARAFSNAVRLAIPAQEISDPDKKTMTVEVRDSDGDGRIKIIATYILRDYSTATNLAAQLVAAPNAALTGRLHIHCCPIEGRIKDWSGCDADRRAQVKEIKL
jgi:hypothetical protein